MNNEQKAQLYHSLLLSHDKLDGQIADIKSESAGMELNEVQKGKLKLLEQQKDELVRKAMSLMNS
jgi:uncharacterized protein YdcH (DUF465 family)|tara:strand:+ start:4460 stop:4654 length:195 start_codon:yes stop_codon:yes gene_type:complete